MMEANSINPNFGFIIFLFKFIVTFHFFICIFNTLFLLTVRVITVEVKRGENLIFSPWNSISCQTNKSNRNT